jgi:hypothetical protein
VLQEEVQTNVSRPVMNNVANELSNLNNDEAMVVGTYAIEKIGQRHLAFEEEVRLIHCNDL